MGKGGAVAKKAAPICFLNLDSINVTPYFQYYERCLSSDYDLIYWDRDEHDEYVGARNVFKYSHKVRKGGGVPWLWDLATGYAGYRRFACRILKENRYEIVVALTGNVAVILTDVLAKYYPKRYIMDIRDYFLEDIALYRHIEQKTIKHAALALVSSPSYEAFLGHHDFQIIHNVQAIEPSDIASIKKTPHPSEPFVIANIGTAKTLDLDRRVIDYFANDMRFQLRYIGRGYDQLNEYCCSRGIRNTIASGDFASSETIKFYRDIDAILSVFGNSHTNFKHCLPNKLYYSAQLELPILVSSGTYMADVVDGYSLGCTLDIESEDAKERILHLYDSGAVEARRQGAERFMRVVECDNEKAFGKIRSLLSIATT